MNTPRSEGRLFSKSALKAWGKFYYLLAEALRRPLFGLRLKETVHVTHDLSAIKAFGTSVSAHYDVESLTWLCCSVGGRKGFEIRNPTVDRKTDGTERADFKIPLKRDT